MEWIGMPNGYNGKILRVNLTDGKVWTESPDTLTYRRYVGGSALALYYLLKHLPKGVDPLGPGNLLVFTTSVICGQPIPGASRFTAAGKSPLTGAFGESEAGGWWGPELKKAGFDTILVQGRAPKPVYLWIHDGQAELRDASKLWGKVTGESHDAIKAEVGDDKARIAQIGPGAEKLVRFGCIINELRHANGRTGMGAVMGSKQLKAIAVRGTQKLPVGDEDGLKACQKWFRSHYQRQPADMHDLGTPRLVTGLDADGILPTRNFIKGHFDKAQDIGAKRMKETMFVGAGTCYGCPIACKREVKVAEGPYQVDPRYGGPEYETLAAFGSLCEVSDLRAVAKANQICGECTIDTISTGACIAFAMECYERGILTTADTGGL
ncbi:MAG: aldehyde ferredoxin oxidoreductase, partial [Planctomycetes bacterium]|nr:aldehyde ferredoxin oxidoreductase [Planctomycetota bacterium]